MIKRILNFEITNYISTDQGRLVVKNKIDLKNCLLRLTIGSKSTTVVPNI